MKSESSVSVQVSRYFEMSPSLVFGAWLDKELIAQWMFGPDVHQEEIVRVSIDPRVGGLFSFVLRRHLEVVNHLGSYVEIVRPKRLVFTWGMSERGSGSRVIIDLIPLDTGCELNLIHQLTPEWAEFAAPMEENWRKSLDSLARFLAR